MITINKWLFTVVAIATVSLANAETLKDTVTTETKKASALYTAAHGILEPAYFVPATFVGAAASQLKNKGFKLAAKNISLAAIATGAIVLCRNKDNITLKK